MKNNRVMDEALEEVIDANTNLHKMFQRMKKELEDRIYHLKKERSSYFIGTRKKLKDI